MGKQADKQAGRQTFRQTRRTNHIPGTVSYPVNDRIHASDKLQMFGFGRSLIHQEHHEGGWDKRHGRDDEHRDQHIRPFQAGDKVSSNSVLERNVNKHNTELQRTAPTPKDKGPFSIKNT